MPNLYASLGDLKAELQKTGTADDAVLLRSLERASREIDGRCARRFYHESATAYFNGNGREILRLVGAQREPFRGDLISVTSVKVDGNRDSTFEYTLVANTDYWLAEPGSGGAGTALEINPYNPQVSPWPKAQRCIEIVGVFGYSNEAEASGTLGAEISSASATSVTMTAGHGLTGGETIIVGTEQMYVSAVSTNTLTVVRGVNGSTAATHSNGAAVTRRRYPRLIEQATVIRAADIWRGTQTGYGQVATSELGGFASNVAFAQFMGLTREFIHMGVA